VSHGAGKHLKESARWCFIARRGKSAQERHGKGKKGLSVMWKASGVLRAQKMQKGSQTQRESRRRLLAAEGGRCLVPEKPSTPLQRRKV